MTFIVGLDLSLTSAGVAILSDVLPTDIAAKGDDCWPVLLRSIGEAGKKDDDYQKRSRRVRRQTAAIKQAIDTVTGWDIALAVIEGPIYGGSFTGAYFDRAILFGGIYAALDARDIPIAVIPPTTGHTFTTGKGSMPKDPKAFKPLIVNSVRAMVPGIHVANDDVADALGLAFMGAMSLGIRPPFRPKRWQHEAVHRSVWPHGAPAVLA